MPGWRAGLAGGCGACVQGALESRAPGTCSPQGGQAACPADLCCRDCMGQEQNRPTHVINKIFLEHPVPCAPLLPCWVLSLQSLQDRPHKAPSLPGQPSADRGRELRPSSRPCLWIF